MTTKEKAKELFDKFYQEAPYQEIEFYSNDVMARQCALIAVDEIIKNDKENYGINGFVFEYWQEVKQELQKI
jgi:hypothetical protein